MGLLKRSSLGVRGLGVAMGALAIGALFLAAAWPSVVANDQSTLGTGVYPAVYAITNAKIVTAPGKSIDPGTIVVRRGMIEAVGLTKDVTGSNLRWEHQPKASSALDLCVTTG